MDMEIAGQSAEYTAFVDKFKPKKTTDDCYTPENVYQAVADWVAKEYGIDPARMVRPFWPGADYEAMEYPEGCVVVDNPPFSILAKIIRHYQERGVRFFLFSPMLTLFGNAREDVCCIATDLEVIYENGARVKTSFITNLDDCRIRTAPDLYAATKAANAENNKAKKLPRYFLPFSVCTSTRLAAVGRKNLIKVRDCERISKLDGMPKGKKIFGYAFIVPPEAAQAIEDMENARTTNPTDFYRLSERERAICESLGGGSHGR